MTPIEVWQGGIRIAVIPSGSIYSLGAGKGQFVSAEDGFHQTDSAPIAAPRRFTKGDAFQVNKTTVLIATATEKQA